MPEFDVSRLGVGDRYKLLIGAVVPRPIALVSSVNRDGALNLAPFSFFNAVGSNPMLVMFCPANEPDGREKDSLRNAAPADEGGMGEFVVNVVSEAIATRAVSASEPLAFGQSEFELSGLTPAPSRVVSPPRVAESPVSFECRTRRVDRFAPDAGMGANMVIGEVVWVHAADGLVNERFHTDPSSLSAVGRMGGRGYARTRERFDLPMGRAALDADPGAAATER